MAKEKVDENQDPSEEEGSGSKKMIIIMPSAVCCCCLQVWASAISCLPEESLPLQKKRLKWRRNLLHRLPLSTMNLNRNLPLIFLQGARRG